MSLLDFKYYSYLYQEDLVVELEFDYSEPQPDNENSDWEYYGGYDIMNISIFHDNGEPVIVPNYKQNLLDNEVRDIINQQLRLLEISDSRFDNVDIDKEFERHYTEED